ncbi:hypothetical protein Glove_583g2 [Diversispora epigaea]|uniref:Uncharacterized protein n=1 Tax=Diversispora epigaea TaxID=1348612 RepID=A0A397GEJ6_9GLOM|nr:hypothetical protein Glove_583g2 [Diversispora epigaea]
MGNGRNIQTTVTTATRTITTTATTTVTGTIITITTRHQYPKQPGQPQQN